MNDPEDKGEGRLSAWSKRKLAAKQEGHTEKPAEVPISELPNTPEEDPEVTAALPALEEITEGSDITPFLAKGVPAHLKKAALRKLWGASPAVRDYADPAVDYAWDWNAPGGVPGGGGTLSKQSVVKMAKDLIGNQTGEKAEEADGEVPEPPAETAHDVDDRMLRAPDAVRRSVQPMPDPSPDAEDRSPPEVAKPETKNEVRPPQRRHGGARPE